jgi:Cu2+-exporting ATPase
VTDGSINIDIEKARVMDHVALNVSGMTCTGCSRKMLNVLRDIPGVSNPHVTFASNTAAFDFDPSKGDLLDVLPLLEKRTGFKLSSVTAEFHELHVLLDTAEAQAYKREERDGLVSFDKVCIAHAIVWPR